MSKGKFYSELVKEFDYLFLSFPLHADISPDLTQIKKILEKNKTKPYFHEELIKFYLHMINSTIFFTDGTINNYLISGKPEKVLQSLLEELTTLIQNEHADSHNETAIDLTRLMAAFALTVKNVTKGSMRNFGQFFYSLVNNPASSFKKIYLSGIYALAGQPVVGLNLSSTFPSTRRIDSMLLSQESEWFKFFDQVEEILKEYNAYPLGDEHKRIFFKFLNLALSGDAAQTLSEGSKESLFLMADTELKKNEFYKFDNINDLQILYRLFDIFLRIEHSNWNEKILNLVSQYAEAILEREIVLDRKIEQLDWHFTNLFWVLNVNFIRYAKEDLLESKFVDLFNFLQKMNREIYRWDQASIFSFRTVLGLHRQLRSTFYENTAICDYLDRSVREYATRILSLTKNQCFFLSNTEIKECVYTEYVRNLTEDRKHLFAEISQEVKKSTVFPSAYKYVTHDQAFKIMIRYQNLTDDEKNIINNAISNTYTRVEALKERLGVSAKPLTRKAFKLHVFASNEQYVKYGPLWGINTAGGGYAHVRSPSEAELPSDYFRERTEDDLWYETFVYQQEGDVRNGKDKEGGSFRNLGHEIQHTLFYALVGGHELNNLPSWMIEGGANALGNEACFKEEADYIKGFKDRLPTIERIINMSYASGGDLYYFGSTLFRFMLEKYPASLKEAIIKAQNGTKLNEINQFIKNSFISREQEFKTWVTEIIDNCSAQIGKASLKKTEPSCQDHYRQDLQNSPRLSRFIQQYGPIEFTFSDTVFVLSTDGLSRHDPDQLKTPQALFLSDYKWFKSALEIYVLKNKLKKLSLETSGDDILIQKLVDIKGEEITKREVKSVGIRNGDNLQTELDLNLEDFVLKKSFGLSKNLKRYLEQDGEINDTTLAYILTKRVHAPSSCAAYLKTDSEQPESPQLNYLENLKNNPELINFIQQYGSIEFTFSDTVFVLSTDRLLRHRIDSAKTPQALTLDDYEWFKSALGLYVIRNKLSALKRKNGNGKIAKLIEKDKDYVDNRRVIRVTPTSNKRLASLIENFVLEPSFDLSTHLKNVLHQLSQSVDQPLPTLGEGLSTADTQPTTLNPLGVTTLITSIGLPLFNATLSNLPALTGNEPTSKEDSNPSNGQLIPVIAVSIGLGLVAMAGASFFYYCCKKKKNKAERKRDYAIEYRSAAEGEEDSVSQAYFSKLVFCGSNEDGNDKQPREQLKTLKSFLDNSTLSLLPLPPPPAEEEVGGLIFENPDSPLPPPPDELREERVTYVKLSMT